MGSLINLGPFLSTGRHPSTTQPQVNLHDIPRQPENRPGCVGSRPTDFRLQPVPKTIFGTRFRSGPETLIRGNEKKPEW